MFSERVQSRSDRRNETRLHVISVAERLFREQGFSATSIRQIAIEAGVSTGTVMAAGDKGALLVAVFESAVATMQREQRRPVTAPDGDAGERILALLQPFLELFSSDEKLSREYAALLVRGSHDSVIFTRLADELLQSLTHEFTRSGLSPERAAAASRTVYFAYLGILFAWAGSGSDLPAALRELRSIVAVISSSPDSES